MPMTQPIKFAGDFGVVTAGIYGPNAVLIRALDTSQTFTVEASDIGPSNYVGIFPKAGTVIKSVRIDTTSPKPWSSYFRITEYQFPVDGSWRGKISKAIIDNTDPTPSPLTISIEAIGKPETVSQINQLYLMDDKKLGELAKAPMYLPGGEGETVTNNSLFIINLLSIPFKIDPSNTDKELEIKLGTFKIGVKAPILKRDMITVELGEITVGGMKGNALDYVATKYELVLPYVAQPIELPPSMVVGKKIKVVYKLDAYNGDITVNVYNGGDIPFISQKNSIGRTIPIKLVEDMSGSIGGTAEVSNPIVSAFIRRIDSELSPGIDSNLVSVEGAIGEYKGFLEVSEIDLKTKANLSESQQIKSLLRSGVVIK